MSTTNSSPSTASSSESSLEPGSPTGPPAGGPPAAGPATGGPSAPEALDRGLLLIAMCVVLGAVMSILDVTVVNVAINTLAREFETPLATIQWVATGYTLALATVIPLTGWGADRFGTKRLYVTSIVLFVSGSVLSGLAWNAESLIGFRILQGFGGGMLMPAGMTILTRAAGPQRLGRVMAVMGVPMLLGPICGPILGGWLVDSFSWRWIFFINIPIGVVALTASLRILPKDVPSPGQRLDLLGLVLLSPSLAAIIYGLAESSTNGGFNHAEVLVPIGLGVVLLGFWFRHTRRTKDALIDLKLFRNKTFAASTTTMMLMIISVFGGMLLLPLYLQAVRGESALSTGLLLAPQGLGAMLAMPISGLLTDRTGVGRIVPCGLALVGLSFLGLTQLTSTTSYTWLSVLLFVQGVGMGFTMMPTMTGAMQTLRRASIARASTTLNIIQQVGASIGTAVMVVILTAAISARIPGAGGGIGGAPAPADTPPAVLADLQAKMAESFGETFWWALGLVLIAFVVALVLLPKQKPEPVEDDDSDDLPAAMMMG
ncbi:MAG TPA: DHA2 family efflux MFS transporter permease subunit [Kineosporiaceae bacterium]|nr:DHA2 family efflux MFS transporter permease subunit [Kineosporiaceae bacterium]